MPIRFLESNRLAGNLPPSWSTLILPHDRFNLSACNEIQFTPPDELAMFVISPFCPAKLDIFPADGKVDCEPACNVAVCGFSDSCNAGYRANASSPVKLWLANNRLTGTVPRAWNEGVPSSGGNLQQLDVNCLAGVASQLFCTPTWLAPCLLAALGVATAACGFKALLLLPTGSRFRLHRELPGAPWLAAWGASAAWGLFMLTPAFDAGMLTLLPMHSAIDMVLLRSLAVFVVPVLLVLAGLGFRATSYLLLVFPATPSRMNSRAACSWTLVASTDVLRENLETVRTDQTLLTALFALLVPCVAWLNFLALPASIIVQVQLETPLADPRGTDERPVTMDASMAVPRAAVALGAASLLVVAYHVVACLLLPQELWLAEAVRLAASADVRRRAAQEQPGTASLLRSLTWMRAGFRVLFATASISACSIGPAVLLAQQDSGVDPEAYDYWEHYRAYKDAGDEPLANNRDPAVAAILACGLAAQLLLAMAWNILCWGLPARKAVTNATSSVPEVESTTRKPFRNISREQLMNAVETTIAPPTARKPWRQVSREQAQRSLLIVAIGVQLIPVLNSWGTLGWTLVALVWAVNLGALVGVLGLIRDHPVGWEDLRGKPMFGLVLLASDLEAALDGYLATCESQLLPLSQIASCCRDHLGGCAACQRLIRRFPATLDRMKRTLAVSYRWQPSCCAIIRSGFTGLDDIGAGLKDGMAGL